MLTRSGFRLARPQPNLARPRQAKLARAVHRKGQTGPFQAAQWDILAP
jgi:hypothetical protein